MPLLSAHDFYSQAHAKWILMGEHAVVRGHSALVFPLHEKMMTLQYQDNQLPMQAHFEGEQGEDLHLLFWSVIEHGLKYVKRDLSHMTGHFLVVNHIPIGSGLGASAALCINIGRWFIWKEWIRSEELFNFAKYLEDLFHGKSSGLDLAGSLYNTGIHFSPQPTHPVIKPLIAHWQPCWYLSFSGQIGITSHCVRKVQHLHQENSQIAQQLDQKMSHCVQLAEQALTIEAIDGLPLLIQAIEQAKECFLAWNLVSSTLAHHMDELTEGGALAVKPTGSGDGGYVLSLWKEPPPMTLHIPLIPVYTENKL